MDNAEITAVDVLLEARQILTPPKSWTQYTRALDAGNSKVGIGDPEAVCFCMASSLLRAVYNLQADYKPMGTNHAYSGARAAVYAYICTNARAGGYAGELRIEAWNDTPSRTHAQVLEMFDGVIREQVCLASMHTTTAL